MTITTRVMRTTTYEDLGLTVKIETTDGVGGGSIHVFANTRAAARASKVEALLQSREPTSSRGAARNFFYWWTKGYGNTGTMPTLDEIIESANKRRG